MALSLIGCGGSDQGASAESASTENPSSNNGQESYSQNPGLKDALAGMHLIDARVHAPAPGQPMSAGYFTLMNHGREAVTLVGINSDAVTVQMHTTSLENNGTTMRPLDAITIAPDDQIIFHSLRKDELKQIVTLQVARLQQRLEARKLDLQLSPEASDWLANAGYDPVYGARPLKRAIQRELETPIAKAILAGQYSEGDVISLDVASNALAFR